MARLPLKKNVEKRIYDVEEFEVIINDSKGHELNPNDPLPRMYPFGNKSWNNWRVAEWQSNKFSRYFPNNKVDVLDGQGNVVMRATTLGKVRDTYNPQEDD